MVRLQMRGGVLAVPSQEFSQCRRHKKHRTLRGGEVVRSHRVCEVLVVDLDGVDQRVIVEVGVDVRHFDHFLDGLGECEGCD